MNYVFDNSPLSVLFRNFYRKRFPSLWSAFDKIVADKRLTSTREALREIEQGGADSLRVWAADNKELFATPIPDEGAFVAGIFAVPHFQQNIEQQKLLNGGFNADPFVVAKAAVEKATVVTMEHLKPNGSGIPNICKHFSVSCMNLEEFMESEKWEF